MNVIEIVNGRASVTEWDALDYETIKRFVDGPIEGVVLNAGSARSDVIAYINAEGEIRHDLAENCHLPNGRIVYGNALVVGIGPNGTDRGLTFDEIERVVLTDTPGSPLPTLTVVSNWVE